MEEVKTKVCNKCQAPKLLSEFYVSLGNKSKSWCKVCQRIAVKLSKQKAIAAGRCLDCSAPTVTGKQKCVACRAIDVDIKLKHRCELKEQAIAYLGGQCSDCDLRSTCSGIYDFHHLDSSIKDSNISALFLKFYAWIKICVELDKCILLCANCHRIRHGLTRTHSKTKARRLREFRSRAVKQLGGVCKHCNLATGMLEVYDFHHIDRATKITEVSTLISTNCPWIKVLAEVEKCILLCANCHRIYHAYLESIKSNPTK